MLVIGKFQNNFLMVQTQGEEHQHNLKSVNIELREY